ncbi:hypothetical protein SGGMMB4_03378 [Sodalis glossinidius str. 'morsitans']|uniref:Uncharacterized protein n=1 Tax=Sodalis glossinidius (strain morsitans) TaxID=343509 RepID=A0A193QKE6_SODGM|nr:hypothetical protein [Sodalis glossinidius]CRL45563.1 hypothetical protein SGGMMB4_03378 [Sodalis glossinidius str. 'morsitans']
MAIATSIDFLRRCIVWPGRPSGDDTALRRLAPEYAWRARLHGTAVPPAGERLPLRCVFTRAFAPQGAPGPLGMWRRQPGEVRYG